MSEDKGNEFEFEEFGKGKHGLSNAEGRNLELLKELPLNIHVELGRTRLPVSEVLQIGKGTVIELNKLAGEPVDIYVNQQFIAKGEVVVIEESFGVRISEIVSAKERLNKLR